MPYIKNHKRAYFIDNINGLNPTSPGDLNYIFTMLAINYFEHNGQNYQAINDIIGALEGTKLEFYRRKAAPYEDTKIEQNGDVY